MLFVLLEDEDNIVSVLPLEDVLLVALLHVLAVGCWHVVRGRKKMCVIVGVIVVVVFLLLMLSSSDFDYLHCIVRILLNVMREGCMMT